MSIIVKDMNMPESCAVCEYGATLTNNDYMCSKLFSTGDINRYVIHGLKRSDWCPLIELPKKHGRLIDADAFIDYLNTKIKITTDKEISDLVKQTAVDLCEAIIEEMQRQKTIVESEE